MYILDNVTKFLAKDSNATYNSHGTPFFADDKSYGEAVRKVKAECLDKQDLRSIAQAINLDEEGSQGRIQVQLLQVDEPGRYVQFFCHFKVLFKFVQIGLSVLRVNALQKKVEKIQTDIKDIKDKMAEEEAVVELLGFHHNIRQESDRIMANEVQFLSQKQQALERRLQDLQARTIAQEFLR